MRKLKKIISVLLAVIMALSVLAVTGSAAQDNTCPVIIVPGVDSSPLYADKDDADSLMKLVETDAVLEQVKKKILPALVTYAADRNGEKLGTVISDMVNDLYGDWFFDYDGNPINNSGTRLTYPDASSVKKDSTLFFYYDWRGDILTAAAELRAYVEYIKESSGCDKVVLGCHSLGSAVALTYLSVYGNDDIMGIVLDTPAVEGVSYLAQLLCGEVSLSAEGILAFLDSTLIEGEYEELISSVLDILDKDAGIPDTLTAFLDDMLKDITPVIFEKSLTPLLACWPSIWAMLDEEGTEKAMDYIFGTCLKDEPTQELQAKINAYNLIRKDSDKIFKEFDEEGRLAVISRYGFTLTPVTDEWSTVSDTVIETKNSSLGATTASAGRYFDDEYLEGKDMKYISPDRTIDASTCLFPEKTWFIKDIQHSEKAITRSYIPALMFGEKEAECDSFELGRFSLFNEADYTLVEDTTKPEAKEETTFFKRLFNFVKALLEKAIDFIVSIFKK